jgi:hypothetical protein
MLVAQQCLAGAEQHDVLSLSRRARLPAHASSKVDQKI